AQRDPIRVALSDQQPQRRSGESGGLDRGQRGGAGSVGSRRQYSRGVLDEFRATGGARTVVRTGGPAVALVLLLIGRLPLELRDQAGHRGIPGGALQRLQ